MKSPFQMAIALMCFSFTISRTYAEEILPISPVYQESPVWCWAAVSEMVFRHYGVPSINPIGDYQCGIAALVHPGCEFNCGNCVVSAPSISYVNNVIRNYPKVAGFRTGLFSGRITSVPTYRALSKTTLSPRLMMAAQ